MNLQKILHDIKVFGKLSAITVFFSGIDTANTRNTETLQRFRRNFCVQSVINQRPVCAKILHTSKFYSLNVSTVSEDILRLNEICISIHQKCIHNFLDNSKYLITEK